MNIIIISITIFFIIGYVAMFIYPQYLRPVELSLSHESRKLLLLSIKSKVDQLSFDKWKEIKNADNPLIFIYLYQMSNPEIQTSLKKNFQLPFDPMASRNIVKPSNQTLKFIKNYLDQR